MIWSGSASAFVTSPRHADVLLVTGPLTRNLVEALEQAWTATPEPKFVVAVGDCAVDGGVFKGSYAVGWRRRDDAAGGPADQWLSADTRADPGRTARAAGSERAQLGGSQLAAGLWALVRRVVRTLVHGVEWCDFDLCDGRSSRDAPATCGCSEFDVAADAGGGGEGGDRQNEAEQGEQVSARGCHGLAPGMAGLRDQARGELNKQA